MTVKLNPGGLHGLALAELSPKDALGIVTASLVGDAVDTDAVHDSLRSALWKLLTGRIYDESMRAWQAVFRHAAALNSANGNERLADRCRLMAELAVESARYGEVNEQNEVLSRPHVREILNCVSSRGGVASRAAVLDKLHLKQANLSRILSTVLVPTGLIERQRRGAEVDLILTPLAKTLLDQRPDRPTGAGSLALNPPLDLEPYAAVS